MVPLRVQGDYDLQVAFVRRQGGDVLILFPVDQQRCFLTIGAKRAHLGGIKGGVDHPVPVRCPDGKRSIVSIQVRSKDPQITIAVRYDGGPLLGWEGKKADLFSLPDCWSLPKPQTVGLAAHLSLTVFESVQLTLQEGELLPAWADPTQ